MADRMIPLSAEVSAAGAIHMTEAGLQRAVMELAAILGWETAHWRPAMTKHGWRTPGSGSMTKGWPDLTLIRVRDRRIIFAELKNERERLKNGSTNLRSDQRRVIEEVLMPLEFTPAQRRDAQPRITTVEVYVWTSSDLDGRIPEILR